jgi:hypothetical protein
LHIELVLRIHWFWVSLRSFKTLRNWCKL